MAIICCSWRFFIWLGYKKMRLIADMKFIKKILIFN
ncbi:hypothetical protein BDK62_103374 [Halomonas alkaliantarctica]|nr:hypothetical protein BDK62_103374 [Halomonas alkaliantarctica]